MLWPGALVAVLLGWALAFNLVAYVARLRVLRRSEDCDRDDPLGLFHAAAAFVLECLSTFLVLLSIPTGWFPQTLRPRSLQAPHAHGPVVLVHGWGLNRGCWWLLRYRLRRDGWGPIYGFNYSSFSADVERAAAELVEFINALPARSAGAPLSLIGHSLGGLVIRYCLRRYRAQGVRRVITLGTPHGGTSFLPLIGPVRRRLDPDSPLIHQLNAGDRVPQQFDVIAIGSQFDALILPPARARYPGAFNIQVRDIGHNRLLFAHRVYVLIRENLEAPLPGAGMRA
jgi:pimeloyl-ACP methyl ester carboxylesterase